jgi:LCP family protein required for cell wall assembly
LNRRDVVVRSRANGGILARAPVTRRRAGRLSIAAAAIVVSLVASGLWLARSQDVRAGSPHGGSTKATVPRYDLVLNLRSVGGRGPSGAVKASRLTAATDAVRHTMTELYSDGFVDQSAWDGGRFPGVADLFASSAQKRVRRSLDHLTLGRAAVHLDAVRPERANLRIQFMLDRGGHPVVAVASMDFDGVGLAGDAELPLRSDGSYVLRHLDGGWRIVSYSVRSRVPSPGQIEAKVRDAAYSPDLPSRGPLFVLVIGSDARPGQSVNATRGDSLHIVGVNPATGTASVLGIPRDSFVNIPGRGTNKINSALSSGGPSLMVRTVEQLTGIHIDAYVLTGFRGFMQMIGAIGGVKIDIPYAMNDRYSGAHFRKGPTHLTSSEALALSRNRHDAPGGDFGRSMNQGQLIIAAFREFRRELRKDPFTMIRWGIAASKFLETNLSVAQMMQLMLAAPTINAGRIANEVVSGSRAMVGGQSVIRLGSRALAMFRDLRRDGVLNGR